MPKISVIMPVYNGEKYLREAIDSILNQTFSDFEFIIINDASQDGCEEIIKSYNDERIVYLKNDENIGVAKTLNRGLDLAKGEYIARMDADDISMPDRFEKQVNFLDKNLKVGLCGSNVTVFADSNEYKSDFSCSHKDISFQLFFSSQLAHPTVMFRKSLVDEGIYRYDTQWEGREDYELWTRLVQKTDIFNISKPLLRYRKHNTQVTQKKDDSQLEKHTCLKFKFLNEMGICVSKDEARIFSKYCIGIKEYTPYEYKVFSVIVDEICKKYNVPHKVKKNIKNNIIIKNYDKSAYIITCHDVYNYGASLQAYALQTFLEKSGINTKIIDYKAPYLSKLFDFYAIPEKLKKNFILKWLFKCYLFKVYIPAIPKFFRYKNFNKKYLKLTDKVFLDNEQLKLLEAADMYFCGSDQIWNSYTYQCGKDPSYFLDFAPQNASKFSYAASFGTNKIDEECSDFIKEKLSRFDAISVREKSGQEILKKLDISDVEFVCDPVFLLSKIEWSRLENKKKEKPYLLLYTFDDKGEVNEIATQIAKRDGLEIKSFSFGRNEYSSGPCEFLHLIKNAHCIVTNSFHAIAFSLIYEKQFWVINRGVESLNERLDNILGVTNLINRKVNTSEDIIAKDKDLIDYSKVNVLLEDFISLSKQYIERCIEIEKNKNC